MTLSLNLFVRVFSFSVLEVSSIPNGVPRQFKECLNFNESFEEVLRVFQGCLRDVSRVFQGSFKGVSRKF